MRIAVTGSSGLIGSALVPHLRAGGHEVQRVVRRPAAAADEITQPLFGRFADRHAVWQGLLDRGVLIRETGPSGSLRVTVGTPQENQLFREAMLATIERIGQ